MMRPTPEEIKRTLCDLTVVEPTKFGFEVALAQVYANGETVAVTVQEEGDGFYVHDGGNGAMILESSGVSASPRLQEELRHGVRAYGCQITQYRVYKQCAATEVAEAIAVVGCASRFVADYGYQTEARPMFDFRRQVVESLLDTVGSQRVRENEEVVTRTGSHYQVSAVILDPRQARRIAFVETVSNHQGVARKFRALYDIKNTPELTETSRFAVFDDSRVGITASDLALLMDVSAPVGFRERNNLSQILDSVH